MPITQRPPCIHAKAKGLQSKQLDGSERAEGPQLGNIYISKENGHTPCNHSTGEALVIIIIIIIIIIIVFSLNWSFIVLL